MPKNICLDIIGLCNRDVFIEGESVEAMSLCCGSLHALNMLW